MPSEDFLLRNWLRSECAALSYAWFTGGAKAKPYDLNLAAIRILPGTPNVFDDWFTCTYLDEAGQWVTHAWPCTTDPGRYWLNNPTRLAGTAIVKPGQYRGVWSVGLHKGRYSALTQVRSITVLRDNDKDAELDYDTAVEQAGLFGINCHASDSNPFDSNDPNPAHAVEKWSAGCIVFADSADYREHWALIQKASAAWGSSFSFTLLTCEGPPPGLS